MAPGPVYADIDLEGVQTRWEFHLRIRESVKTPDYYGNNLDALADIMRERGGVWRFRNWGALQESAPAYAAALQRLWNNLSQEVKGIKILLE